MKQSVRLKRPRRASGLRRVLLGMIFLGPICLLGWFWVTGRAIRAADPVLNLLAHALLVGIPVLWGILLTCKPLQFEDSEEISLGRTRYVELLRTDWWMTLVLWAAPVFALMALGIDCLTVYLPVPERLATSAAQASVRVVIALVMTAFYGVVAFEGVETRIAAGGIRSGLTHFYEWENIDHVSLRGGTYSVYHKANSALPACSFRLSNDQANGILNLFLKQFEIPVVSVRSKWLPPVELGVVAAFTSLLAGGFVVRYGFGLPLTWAVAAVFLAGLVLGYGLERIRGVDKHTRQRPAVR